MKKKLLSLALAAVMVMSLSATALAGATTDESTGVTTYSDDETITISKIYTAINTGTTSPEETFYLVQKAKDVVDSEATSAPDLEALTGTDLPEVEEGKIIVGSINFAKEAATASSDIEIKLPKYDNVGIYKYTLEEVAGTTAGVDYFDGDIYLVVTVINDDEGNIRIAAVHTETSWDGEEANNGGKSDEIENTYSAGTLSVTKTVEGNLGDKDKSFEFTVAFTTPNEKTWVPDVDATVNGEAYDYSEKVEESTDSNGNKVYTITFYLTDGQTITFDNIPYNVTYSVLEVNAGTETEKNEDGYFTEYDSNESGAISSASVSTTVKNTKDGEVDTGINLDTIPYIMILAVVFAGAAYMVFRKRMSDRY